MSVPAKLFVCGLAIAALTAALPGCQEQQAYGYVQITRDIKPAPRDVYLLNGKALRELHTSSELVLKEKVGAGKLVLLRGDRVWTLCTFELTKNRVVTATLTAVRGAIKCAVRG